MHAALALTRVSLGIYKTLLLGTGLIRPGSSDKLKTYDHFKHFMTFKMDKSNVIDSGITDDTGQPKVNPRDIEELCPG